MEYDSTTTGYLFLAVIRIGAMIYCVNRAGSLNRSEFGWGIFAFVFPIIALIAIHLVKPITLWEEEPSGSHTDK